MKSAAKIDEELQAKFDNPETSLYPRARMIAHVIYFGETFGSEEFGSEELSKCLQDDQARWLRVISAFGCETSNPPYTPDVFPRMEQFGFLKRVGGSNSKFKLTDEALKVSKGFQTLAGAEAL